MDKKEFSMKNVFRLIGIVALVAAIGFTFAACDDEDNNGADLTPGTPTGVYAYQYSDTEVHIMWNAVSGAARYKVYGNLSAGGTYDYMGEVTSVGARHYGFNPSAAIGETLYYKVSAVNSYGESGLSNYASVVYVSSVVKTLNGVWTQDNNTKVMTVSGSTATLNFFEPSGALGQSVKSKGYVKVGDQMLRSISGSGTSWTAQWLLATYNTSNPGVATGTAWTNVTITLSNDGNTMTISGTASGTGDFTDVFYRWND